MYKYSIINYLNNGLKPEVDVVYITDSLRGFLKIEKSSLKGLNIIAQGKRSTTLGCRTTAYTSQSASGLKYKSNHAT